MPRIFRYQGAIVRNHHILLIRNLEKASGRDYWLIPGGGMEAGETEEQCLIREIKEETHLDVKIESLLFEDSWAFDGTYKGAKTFLCTPISGDARPGREPEVAQNYSIVETRWVDFRDEISWGAKITEDPFTYPLLRKIQSHLGYSNPDA